jgi:hypothetical protein
MNTICRSKGSFTPLASANTANAAQHETTKRTVMSNKAKPSAPTSASGSAAPSDTPTFRSNPEVDAKIDAYVKENPKYWAYVQAMPRERLERSVVLNEVRELDRQQRIREGVLKQINRSPELKRAYELLVKDLPEDQKENVIAQIGRVARRAVTRVQGQQQQKPAGVGV